jgi:DNA-binding MarR family transcriptional regulator
MPKIPMKEIADTILDFEEQYNDKIASIFRPAREEKQPLTKSQVKVLFMLVHRPEQTATELGDALNMTKASLTGIIDALEAEGLAKRSSDSEDRRRMKVTLTAAGCKLCDAKAREIDAKLELRFASFSEAERVDFVRQLRSAAQLLKKVED